MEKITKEEDLSSEGEGESEEYSDDDDYVDGIPVNSSEKLLKHIQRDLNMLSDESKTKRKFGLMNLNDIFVTQKAPLGKNIMQEMLPSVQKALLKRFSDPAEKNRELAILILKKFFEQCDDLTISFPYLFPVLVEKLGAEDLDGIDSLPDVMKPPPSQKPKIISNPPEPSEEVRLQIAEIVTLIVKNTIIDCFRSYLDDLVNILCALAMDPYGEVVREACDAYYNLCSGDREILFHFGVKMGKSTFLALTHKHAKVRCAGLKALNMIMYVGAWKFTVDLFEALIGFRDPHTVPIKDFYEPSIKLNYFARLVVDRSTLVRETFYKTLANWLLKLPDKVDHEGRILPYMLSALNDPNDNIQDLAFDLIEEMGIDYEEREEEKVRDKKQYALDSAWTNGGEFVSLPLPKPFKHRPRLGARQVIKSYIRRYLEAIYKELSDWIIENRARAAHLLLCLIVYTEDYVMQFLDHLLLSMYKAILEKEDMELKEKLEVCATLLGRYCPSTTFVPFFFSAICGEYTYSWSQVGALKTFGCTIAGSIEVIPKNTDLELVDDSIQRIFDAIEEHVIEPLDFELSEILVDSLTRILDMLLKKIDKDNISIKGFDKYERQLFKMISTAFGVFNTHSLFNKESSESNSKLKNVCIELFSKASKLIAISRKEDSGSSEEYSILQKWLPVIFHNISNSAITEWTFQDQGLRILNGFVNHMDEGNSNAKLQEELIKFEKEENEEFRNRIDHYAWEKKEEVRTRYNRHLHEKNNSKTEELKTITEEEKENVNPDDPNIEEEIDTTKKKNSAFQLAGKKEATGQKEDDTIKLEIDFNNYLMPYDTVINMAANSIIKLLQHPSYEMIKFALSKIYPLMKLVQGDIKQKAKIIFRILSVSLSVEIKHRDRRNQFSKEILNILGDIKKDDLLPISIESCPDFYNFLNHLSVNYQNYNLEIRKDSIKIMHYFLKEYVEFMDNNNSQRDTILQENKSLDQLFKDLYTLANESDEDIRFIATDSLRIIIEEFIPNRKIEKTQEYNEDLKKIRKNLSKAFDNTEMINKIDFYSSQETQKNEYECIQGIIKLAIDETHEANRDLLLDIIFTLNKKLPFTLIKDFRIANVKGMFRRVELLQNIVVTK